jgi:hypothetical protein
MADDKPKNGEYKFWMDIYVFELASRFLVPDLILGLFLAYPGVDTHMSLLELDAAADSSAAPSVSWCILVDATILDK